MLSIHVQTLADKGNQHRGSVDAYSIWPHETELAERSCMLPCSTQHVAYQTSACSLSALLDSDDQI
jgi:hypothetical protein